MNVIDKAENKYIKIQIKDKSRNRKENPCGLFAVKTAKNGRSGGTRTHGLQYPKLARYHLRYASKRIKTIEFCCGQLCGQHRNLTDFSEWVKCEKSSVFKGFQHFCGGLIEQETTSTRNWRATNCATPRSIKFYAWRDKDIRFLRAI